MQSGGKLGEKSQAGRVEAEKRGGDYFSGTLSVMGGNLTLQWVVKKKGTHP